MELNYFRLVNSSPAEIISLESNERHIFIFRKNGILDIYNTESLTYIFSLDLQHTPKFTCLTDDGKLLVSTTENIVLINTLNFEISVKNINASCIGYNKNGIYYTEGKRVYNDDKIVHKCNSEISAMLIGEMVVLGEESGGITVLSEGIVEFSLGPEKITSIVHIHNTVFGATTKKGSLITFDARFGTIIQKVKVRDSNLNACLFHNGVVYCTGLDSRLISYKLKDSKLYQSYQVDSHYAECMSITLSKGRIITGGRDGMIVVHWPEKTKFRFKRIYNRIGETVFGNKIFAINNAKSLDLYELKEVIENEVVKENNTIEDEVSCYGITMHAIPKSIYEKRDYKYLISLKPKNNILAHSINESHFSYSTVDCTKVYSTINGIKEIASLDASYQILMNDKYLIRITLKLMCIVYDLSDMSVINRFLVSEYDRFFVHGNCIVGNKIYNFLSGFVVEHGVQIICGCGLDSENVLMANTQYEIRKVNINTGESYVLYDKIVLYDILGIIYYNSQVIYYDSESIVINNHTKYDLERYICGLGLNKGELVLVQKLWDEIIEGMEGRYHKDKYKNK